MKKIIVFLLTLILIVQARAQAPEQPALTSFYNRSNLTLFTGLVTGNKGHLGHYYGAYGDITLNKNPNFMHGVFAQIAQSGGRKDSYRDGNYEFGGGYFLGLYKPELSEKFQGFFSSNIGLLVQKDHQEDGFYLAKQNDLFLKLDVNLNFLKRNEFAKWFPRTQIEARYKNSIRSSKVGKWKDEVISTDPWNKNYLEVIFKQSVFRNKFSKGVLWSPKIVAYYSHAWGDSRSFYGLGLETSLFKMFRDDFLSLQILYKESNNFSQNYLVIGLNFNILNLLKKNK